MHGNMGISEQIKFFQKIKTVDENAFKDNTKLERLDIAFNKIFF
jgi:hypothetical protein